MCIVVVYRSPPLVNSFYACCGHSAINRKFIVLEVSVEWTKKCKLQKHKSTVISTTCTRVGCFMVRHTVYPMKYAHGFVVLCFVVVMQSFIMNSNEVFIHIHQGCFAGTGAIVRLPQCQWSKPDGYGKISQCITTTKHSKAKTVCIFLGIYCNSADQIAHGKYDCRAVILTMIFYRSMVSESSVTKPLFFNKLHYTKCLRLMYRQNCHISVRKVPCVYLRIARW